MRREASAQGRSGLAMRGPADLPTVVQEEVEQAHIGNHEGARPPQVGLGQLRLAPGAHRYWIGGTGGCQDLTWQTWEVR